jgi:hypothetical protein
MSTTVPARNPDRPTMRQDSPGLAEPKLASQGR